MKSVTRTRSAKTATFPQWIVKTMDLFWYLIIFLLLWCNVNVAKVVKFSKIQLKVQNLCHPSHFQSHA